MANLFGGDWTEEKLRLLHKYLVAYATIMRKQHFRFAYIDAFAGTGYRGQQKVAHQEDSLFPELADQDSQKFVEGSARIALQVEPKFDKYIFIEQSTSAFQNLIKLSQEFSEHAGTLEFINADANSWLKDRCLNYDWSRNRAVVFLDPFGMQVEWATIEAIAQTEAIDLWILFPLGVAVNRLLTKDLERIDDTWRTRLDSIFGTSAWAAAFYLKFIDLLGTERKVKAVDLEGIGRYYNDRLKEAFSKGGVAYNPRPLYNSRGNPLYLFCFASGNPKGARTALKIAQHILSS